MGGVEFKPRDLRDDRGYRVAGVVMWVGLNLNPHPLKTEGAAPNYWSRRGGCADMGRSGLRPYTSPGVRLVYRGG
jgi:hypothetical protein